MTNIGEKKRAWLQPKIAQQLFTQVHSQPERQSPYDRGCVKTHRTLTLEKIDLSDRSVCVFLDLVNGEKTPEFHDWASFHTASTRCCHLNFTCLFLLSQRLLSIRQQKSPPKSCRFAKNGLRQTGVAPSATRPAVSELTKLTIQSTITSSLNESATRLPAHSTE